MARLAVYRSLAIHEAGHAVAAIQLRLSLRYTMLLARALVEGSTVCSLSRDGSPDRDRREAVLAYAGCEAERRELGYDNAATALTSLGDFDSALKIGRRLVGEKRLRAWVDERRGEAEALVTANWIAIEAVADAIVQHRKLSGPEVRAIVLSAS